MQDQDYSMEYIGCWRPDFLRRHITCNHAIEY